ncbi:MFS transporter [Nonomuraea endophytica]|uniref:Fucose permease n=1 Tax=Nonomuraea endophytica TaxID=714136 RepID=A0A7W8ADU3_9ACTN|nr:MFS transporter [Nonomuraea endophytica]MBB5084481.1 fucose permease [Nonomuraea endophytica]
MPLILVCAVWGVFWGSWAALLPAVKEHLAISTADLGLALSGVPVGAIPAMALAGRLARGRERAGLTIATALFGLSILAVAGAVGGGPYLLAGALLLLGAASGALDVTLNLATGRAERQSGRRLFQPVYAAFPLAVIAAAPATGLARQLGVGPGPALVAVAVLVLVLGAALAPLSLPQGPPSGTASRTPTPWRQAALLGALAACVLIIENAVEQWSALLLEDHLGATALLSGSAPAVYMAALTVGRLLAQVWPRLGTRTLLAVAGLGGGAGIVLAGLAPSPAWALAGFALTGLALGPPVPALLSRAAADDPGGSLVAAISTISYAGFVASPLLVGALSAAFGLAAALASLALLAVPLLVAAARR